jgi:stage II sporulation protein R
MKKRRIFLILIIIAIILLSINVNSAFVISDTEDLINAYNNNNLLRFHIVANSNSPEDQYLKRLIRDELIKLILQNSNNEIFVNKELNIDLDNIKLYTENYLQEMGFNYPVKLELGNFYFSKRSYGNISLPAGDYKALKIIIGKGQGSNWWCVLMPPLCIGKEIINKDFKQSYQPIKIEYRFKMAEIIKIGKFKKPEWAQKLLEIFY